MRHIHFGSQVTHLEESTKPNHPLNRTLVTLDGENYTNATLKRVDPDGLIISYADGVTKLKFKNLSTDLQTKYGYDPEKAASFRTQLQADAAARQEGAIAQAKEKEKQWRDNESENQRREEEAAENAAAMNQPPLHIKVNQVVKNGVLADLMETGSVGSSMSRIGGGGGVCFYYKRSGHIVYIQGLKNVVDDDELNIKAKRDGTFAYINTLGANSTVEKYIFLMKTQ